MPRFLLLVMWERNGKNHAAIPARFLMLNFRFKEIFKDVPG